MSWNKLSMAERADIMKLAVESGIYNLDTIRSAYNEFAEGGSIHIKPENRGKFTALKERTGHSATWFKENGTPAQKKMATFALNSRHWNKQALGGPLVERANSYPIGGPLTNALARVRRATNGSVIAASKAIINNSLNNMYQNTVGKYVFGNSSTEKPAVKGALVGAKVGVPTTQVVNPDYTDLVDFLTADRNEGFLAEPTDIGDGKITIGSGLTNKKWLDLYKQRGNVWSKEDNRAAVLEEIKERSARLAKSLPNFNTLPLDSQKALISYDYNVGMSPNNHPNLWKAAKNKDWGTVANEMNATSKNPNFVKGLERRRKEEQDWFRRGFKAYGGNLYNDGGPTEDGDINLFRRNGNYFYQATPNSEEIPLTILDTSLSPDNPVYWTYTDKEGRRYTPKSLPSKEKTITKKWNPYSWRSIVPFEYSRNSYYRPEDALEAFNTITFGGLNNFSPTQWARRAYDLGDLWGGNMSKEEYWDRWINGNEGLVSKNFNDNHPYWSMAFNGIGDAVGTSLPNILNNTSKAFKYLRLNKTYGGVPHKKIEGTINYMDEVFPYTHNKHTVWTTNDYDYAHSGYWSTELTNPVFDVYTDPKALKVLDTPAVPDGHMLSWGKLPYKIENGKVMYRDNVHDFPVEGIPRSKEISLKRNKGYNPNYSDEEKGVYIISGKSGHINDAPTIKTDNVVKYSKNKNYDATQFHSVVDGPASINGVAHDYPIDELVLNPGAEKFVLPHGTSKYKLWDQLPDRYFNLLPESKYVPLFNLIKKEQ